MSQPFYPLGAGMPAVPPTDEMIRSARRDALYALDEIHHEKGTKASVLVKEAEILTNWILYGLSNDPTQQD